MKRINKKIILLVILIVAAFLRIYKLDSIPPSMTPDEVALGYNAYSILKTGRDEYGKLLPIVFKSFGDFKPGLYIYWTVPFVAIFGLNEFGTRVPSAVAGVVGVYLLYLVLQKLFKNEKLSLFGSLILAISPWHIHFSRGAWEINLSLTLTLAGIYFFLRSLEKEKYLLFSALFFGLTLITYQGAKLATAVVVVPLILLYFKKIFSFKAKTLVASSVLGLIISLPIILSFFTGQVGRLKVFSVFSYKRPAEYLTAQLDQGGEKVGDLTYYLFHSETLNLARGVLGRYFNHFSGRFLFFEGDWQNPRHSSPYNGMLLLGDLLLLILGLFSLSKLALKKEVIFLWSWLLLSPLPSALSRDEVHAVRGFNIVAPITMVLAFGAVYLVEKMKYLRWAYLPFYLFGVVYFLDSYFIHLSVHNSLYWEYGYKQAVEAVVANMNRYQKVYVRQSFAQPYMYFLFYMKYDPAKYQKQANLIASEYGDVGRVEKFDNFYFLPIDWTVNRGDKGTIFVADPVRIPPQDSSDPKEFEVISEIKYLDGKSALRVIGVRP